MNKKSAFCSRFYFSFVVYGGWPTHQNNYKSEKGADCKMREKWQKQMPLVDPAGSHPQEKELEAISNVIITTPIIVDRVLQDLNRGKIIPRRKGANGMSAEQVLRTLNSFVRFSKAGIPMLWTPSGRDPTELRIL